MGKIVFESEIYGTKAVGGIYPFQIIVKESFENGLWKVETIRREYTLEENEIVSKDQMLTASMWREE